jgi:hypothetical protein
MFDFLVQHVTLSSIGVILSSKNSLFGPNTLFLSSVGRPSLWITERNEILPSPLSFLLSQTSRKNSRDSALPIGSASFWPEIRDFGGIHSLPGAEFVSQSIVFSVNFGEQFLISGVDFGFVCASSLMEVGGVRRVLTLRWRFRSSELKNQAQ